MAIISNFPAGGGGSKSLNNAVITLATSSFVYDGTEKNQQIQSVVLNGTTLHEGADYLVTGNLATEAGTHTISVLGIMDYGGIATATWNIAKAQGSVSVEPSSLKVIGKGSIITATINTVSNGIISASSSDENIVTASVSGNVLSVVCVGNGDVIVTVSLGEENNYLGASCEVNVTSSLVHVYGVSWDKSDTTILTRTDDAALFIDPTPAVGTGSGSSPFDDILPWSGMVKETVDGNVMVKIPKFWYKWTDENGVLKLQIVDGPLNGFHVSPAHMDRGDGKGERDYVYVGRYHCNSGYKSQTGMSPRVGDTRASARSGIQALGSGYYMFDFAMWWTINMLYLVEFADWDCQKTIGKGCGNSYNTIRNTGTSDDVAYHTGTHQPNRNTYYEGVQYRWIEDLWAGVFDWIDGIRFSGRNVYAYINPSEYGNCESSGGTQVFSTNADMSSCISDYNVPTISGLEWALFPSKVTGAVNYTSYVADSCSLDSSSVVAYTGGGYYSQGSSYGLFRIGSGAASTINPNGYIGVRLQYLP